MAPFYREGGMKNGEGVFLGPRSPSPLLHWKPLCPFPAPLLPFFPMLAFFPPFLPLHLPKLPSRDCNSQPPRRPFRADAARRCMLGNVGKLLPCPGEPRHALVFGSWLRRAGLWRARCILGRVVLELPGSWALQVALILTLDWD